MVHNAGKEYKVPKSGSGKEKAKDIPSRFKGEKTFVNESGKDFAKRLLDADLGEGNWKPGTGSEFNQLKKYGDRGFVNPTKK